MALRWPFGDPSLVRRDFLVLWGLVGLVGAGMEVSRRHIVPHLSFLAVGQGDCTVLQDGGQVMVVDVGGKTEHMDAGERLVVPELRRLAVDRIDLLVLTHPDADHVGGLSAVASHFRIGAVAVPAHFQGDTTMLGWLRGAGIDPGIVHWVKEKTDLQVGLASVCLWTAPAAIAGTDNDGSMVTRIRQGRGSVILTGDASSAVEAWLAKQPGWEAQILKAGHHGSRFSASTEWLKHVHPVYTVFSAGRTNTYGHPSLDALERASRQGRIWRTDRQGTLTFRLESSGFVPILNR
ncbi:MAG: MBL fold metallo-hydrolase [Armatimonadetes bacterium]|nr:MBL fold metallo-hydrolase [Armatimonadota bacterium]